MAGFADNYIAIPFACRATTPTASFSILCSTDRKSTRLNSHLNLVCRLLLEKKTNERGGISLHKSDVVSFGIHYCKSLTWRMIATEDCQRGLNAYNVEEEMVIG